MHLKKKNEARTYISQFRKPFSLSAKIERFEDGADDRWVDETSCENAFI